MKVTKEYLKARNISENNGAVQAILKLTEKNPNYEFFFIKSHFGTEHVALKDIEETFKTMRDKNIKVSRSVDQYVRFVVKEAFTHKVNTYNDKGEITGEKKTDFEQGEVIDKKLYKSLPDFDKEKVDVRTDFEAFSDEIRDALTKTNANKIIQQFPAAAKHVVENLTPEEKKEFYFNLNSLLEMNTKYLVVNPFVKKYKVERGDRTEVAEKTFNRGAKLTLEVYKTLTDAQRENVLEEYQKPLLAFIKKSARYKNKEALFSDLNAAMYSLSGDEEYKSLIERIEDTEGAILEGLNPDKGIVVASALNAEAYKKIGGNNTNHCIRAQHTFSSYVKFAYKQYLITNTKLEPTDDLRIIGMTIDGRGNVTHAHTKSDVNIRDRISGILLKWNIAQYVKPMSEDDIIEMLYIGINDGTIFTDKERSDMVVAYLPKLDKTRFEKKKLLQFIRHCHEPKEMMEIVRTSLDMRNSKEFSENYDYLANNILKLISDENQSYNIVQSFVAEYNNKVGITPEDAVTMLVNKSKYIQPNKLLEIIGRDKFQTFIKEFTEEQFEKILNTIPQFFINFVRDRKTLNNREIVKIIAAMYEYETRKDIRQLVLIKIYKKGYFDNLDLTSHPQLLNLIVADNNPLDNAILAIAVKLGHKDNKIKVDDKKIDFASAIQSITSSLKPSSQR